MFRDRLADRIFEIVRCMCAGVRVVFATGGIAVKKSLGKFVMLKHHKESSFAVVHPKAVGISLEHCRHADDTQRFVITVVHFFHLMIWCTRLC